MIRTLIFILAFTIPIGFLVLALELKKANHKAEFWKAAHYHQVDETEKYAGMFSDQVSLTWRCIALTNSFTLNEKDFKAKQQFIKEYIGDH